MRTHNPEKMALLRFIVALKGFNLKTENDLLIPCVISREMHVTDCIDEALKFARDLPFRWQLSEEAADGA